MKVLYLVEEHGDEGARWHRGLFGHLRRWGVEVEVLNLNRSPGFRRAVEDVVDGIAELGAPGDYWKTLPGLRRRLAKTDAEVIHGIELIPTFYGAVARWLRPGARPPLVYGRHHLETRGPVQRIMERIAFAGSSRVFAVSEEARRAALDEHRGAPAEKVAVIYNGIALEGGEAGEAEEEERLRGLRDDPGRFTVLLLGRLRPEKGHDVALKAAERLRSEGRDLRWIFAGDGPLAAELEALIDARGLDQMVERPGRVKDVGALFELADVVVVPSRWESFGLVAVEAMAAGVPVVASEVGGLPEVVADGETGVLVPPEDPAALAAALGSLLDEPERARRLGRAGRERYRERFTPEAMARAHLREYRALAAGAPVSAAVERVDVDAAGPPWREEHLARYREMIRRGGAGGTVLDLACGSGSGSRLLAEEGAERIVAADLSAEAVSAARSRLSATKGAALVVRCDGTALPLPKASVDAVACFETLEHVPDDRVLLSELHRVLRPGGRLFLSTPNGGVTNPEGGTPDNPFHAREYTPEELDRRVEPLFRVEEAAGQHLPEAYGVAPFLPSFRRAELGLVDRLRFVRWRILLRLPGVRDRLHRFFTGFDFHPRVRDYTFRSEDRERAHVQYLVLRKEGP